MLAKDEKKAEQSSGVFIADAQNKIQSLQSKLQRLLDSYLDQDIDQHVYRAKQAELLSEKKSLEEQTSKLTLAANSWVEPMRQWLKQAGSLCEIAKNAEPVTMKQAFSEIDGLNLFLTTKKARLQPHPSSHFPPENIWLALRAAKEKAAHADGNSEKSLLLAERGGFEPPKTYGLTAFRERPVQPLLHLSMQLPYFTSIPQEFPEALPQPQSHPRNGGF